VPKWNQKFRSRHCREAPRAAAERVAGANRLTLIRAFLRRDGLSTRAAEAFGANFFRGVNPATLPRLRACERVGASSDARAHDSALRHEMCWKPAFHRHFLIALNFFVRDCAAAKIFRCAFCR